MAVRGRARMSPRRRRLDSIEREYGRYQALGEGALEQVADTEFLRAAGADGNSITTLVWHLSGNLESRFTDFLSSDGEKPWRDRDTEFLPRDVSRPALFEKWRRGWDVLFASLEGMDDEHLDAVVTIRGVPFSVHEALHRSLAHTSYHVGQIVLLAKALRGPSWRNLSIPRGRSAEYAANPTYERGPEPPHGDDRRNPPGSGAAFSVVTIREERLEDAAAIRAVNDAAFGQTDEGRIVDALRANGALTLSLVAVLDDSVVGHIAYSPVRVESPAGDVDGAGLGPVAVRPDAQRKGIGSKLVVEGTRRLQRREGAFIVVLGHPEYYPRFGFVPASRYGIRSVWAVPDDTFLILALDPRRLAGRSGLARYRDEFGGAG